MRTASFVVLAALSTMVAEASEFAGGYFGAKVGTNHSEMFGLITEQSRSATTSGIEGGYGWDVGGGSLLGVDGFYDSNSQVDHSPTSRYGTNVYGLALKAGFPMAKWLPYAKIGVGHTSANGTASNRSGNGLHSALGIEYKLAPSWSAAAAYSTNIASYNGTRIVNQNITFGVNYHFGAPKAAPAPQPVAMKEAPKPEPVVAPPPPPPAPVAAPAPPPPPKESWKIIKEQKPVTIEGANFDFGSSKLRPAADAKLQPVVEFAKKYPEAGIEVRGYTDSVGTQAYNQKLSERRAASVKARLVKKGIEPGRITTKGYGENGPIASNKTAAGRAANRRVEVHYVVMEERKVRAE